ncbi:PREDICTED: butyrophilin subfamily 1 member A1-like [Mesitornis unicolor]|uniref:butyrophilin subfamily 1 member A1-like n=1 Tax=Mesitornis unicolor TaxID=54374 RepID=UPI000528B337|nr:PREDICTED: butyrophilin subfamily 1 member A1-like [Mesitornis unicolor]
MGFSVQLTAVIFILVLVSTHHPTAGGGHDPLLVLDGYENDGIRLKCFSERLFSEVQVLWTDGRGDNVTGTPLTTNTTTANASSTIILKPGSGNSVSCKIIDKLLKTSTESSVVIAENQDMLYKIGKDNKVQKELEFRRAHSNAVNITLDENCKHPNLTIKEKNRVMSSTQEAILPREMVVATEGFSEMKHYWEVEVREKSEWELGVVCEEIRNTLRSNMMNTLPKGNLLSLRFSKGEYSLTGGKGRRNSKPCSVVGVFLDQDFNTLSFFDAEGKCLLESLSFEFSGNLYPFFCPGSDGKWLGVRPA